MNKMNDDLMWDIETEIDHALRSAPLVDPPPDLYTRVMSQVTATAPVPHFRITLLDVAVSCVGSLLVAIFVAFFVFMPAPLRSEMLWLTQWVDYLGRMALIWVLPYSAAVAVLAASFVLVRSLSYGIIRSTCDNDHITS